MSKNHHISLGHSPQIQTINLQFTPKNDKFKKPRPLSDRFNLPINSTSTTPKSERVALLEKKKNYSESIRQKNLMGVKIKKKTNAIIDLRDHPSQIKQEKQNCPSSSGKKNSMSIRGRLQNSLKKKGMFYGNRQSISALNFQEIQKKQEFCNQTLQNLMPIQTEQDEFNIHESLYKIKKPIKQFSICSKIINEKIVFEEPEKKEKLVQVLQKQNLTFKKELALFRKQNTQLKKQLQVSQLNLQECEQRAKQALQNSSIIENSRTEVGQMSFNEDNICQIMDQIQKENNELRAAKSNLQLKVYMAEKRILEEVDLWKKKMARQISMWREKYAKLRTENIKIKSYRDLSFSMQISKDD